MTMLESQQPLRFILDSDASIEYKFVNVSEWGEDSDACKENLGCEDSNSGDGYVIARVQALQSKHPLSELSLNHNELGRRQVHVTHKFAIYQACRQS